MIMKKVTRAERNRMYYLANRERISRERKEYYIANKARIDAYNKAYSERVKLLKKRKGK